VADSSSAGARSSPESAASFFTLSGSGFAEPSRHAPASPSVVTPPAEAGFAGIGLHADDLPRTMESGLDADGMRAGARRNRAAHRRDRVPRRLDAGIEVIVAPHWLPVLLTAIAHQGGTTLERLLGVLTSGVAIGASD
jgi:hypothetical protein